MWVKYEDGLAEVSVQGVNEPVKRGEPVEVPDETGRQLCSQDWQEVSPPKQAGKTPATPTPVEKENK